MRGVHELEARRESLGIGGRERINGVEEVLGVFVFDDVFAGRHPQRSARAVAGELACAVRRDHVCEDLEERPHDMSAVDIVGIQPCEYRIGIERRPSAETIAFLSCRVNVPTVSAVTVVRINLFLSCSWLCSCTREGPSHDVRTAVACLARCGGRDSSAATAS